MIPYEWALRKGKEVYFKENVFVLYQKIGTQGPVVRPLRFHHRWPRFHPCQGTKIPQATRLSQEKKLAHKGTFRCFRINAKCILFYDFLSFFNEFGFLKFYLFYLFYLWLRWVFVAACRLSLVAASGLFFVAARRLLIAVASLCCGARALGTWASVVVARGLYSTGSVVVAHGLCCSVVCGIFLDQGLNLCPLHWQADS